MKSEILEFLIKEWTQSKYAILYIYISNQHISTHSAIFLSSQSS